MKPPHNIKRPKYRRSDSPWPSARGAGATQRSRRLWDAMAHMSRSARSRHVPPPAFIDRPLSTEDLKRFNDPGPRGNISQGGGAFLRHPEGPSDKRRHRVPKYAGHRPYSNVMPVPIGHGGVGHFDRTPHVKGNSYVVPGYAGHVAGAQETFAQTHCLLPSPSQKWLDSRHSAAMFDSKRDYRAEVGGLVPGYKGHVPEALRHIGASTYGGLMTRQGFPDHLKWAQSRHDMPFAQAHAQAAAATQQQQAPPQAAASDGLFEKPSLMQASLPRPASAVELRAQGIWERSGGAVPMHAALAAAQAAARNASIKADFDATRAAEAKLAELRTKTKSDTVRQGVLPGYNGHMPRSRESVARSAFREEGLNSVQVGRKQFRHLRVADKVGAPASARQGQRPNSRPQSARGARPGELVQVL